MSRDDEDGRRMHYNQGQAERLRVWDDFPVGTKRAKL
jgi:hypothetical protein